MILLGSRRRRSGGGVEPDPHIGSVSSLLKFEGANNGTTFTDLVTTWTVVANAKTVTSQYKFGTSSGYFDGSSDYIYTPSNSSFGVGTGDFTFEFWARFEVLASRYFAGFDLGGGFLWFNLTGGGYIQCYFASATKTSVHTFSINTWYHIALSRNSGTTRVFVDGVQEMSGGDTINYGSARAVRLGGMPGAVDEGGFHKGWLDEFRFTKGVGRYSAEFTPPTTEFPIS